MSLPFKKDPDFEAHNRVANDTAARELQNVLEQIESAQAAKADASKDESDLYVVAKAKGYNIRALKRLVKERKRDAEELREEEDALTLYKQFIGMA